MVREGGIYYIFCDGADESDKPSSGVAEGSIMFVLVRKDGYTSIGPFDDITRLNDEMMEQCEYMIKAQSITQEETIQIMEVAANIQLGNEGQHRQVPLADEEYSKWNIYKKDGAYYYENKRVRIFMDLRENAGCSSWLRQITAVSSYPLHKKLDSVSEVQSNLFLFFHLST